MNAKKQQEFLNVIDGLLARVKVLEAEKEAMRAFHPRAWRLMTERKDFLVVKTSEKYSRQVVELIKADQGDNWTEDDEEWAMSRTSSPQAKAEGKP